jgi:diacylglycerol kinase (ATP)
MKFKDRRTIQKLKNAYNGLEDVYRHEKAFRIEIRFFVILSFILPFLAVTHEEKFILFFSLFFPLLAELINTAIERTVDLVTVEYNEMAKAAKDIGAAIVFVSIFLTFSIWFFIIYINFIDGKL